MTDPRPWTKERAIRAVRYALTSAPAGPERASAQLALDWLELRMGELEHRSRAEDDTKEIPIS